MTEIFTAETPDTETFLAGLFAYVDDPENGEGAVTVFKLHRGAGESHEDAMRAVRGYLLCIDTDDYDYYS